MADIKKKKKKTKWIVAGVIVLALAGGFLYVQNRAKVAIENMTKESTAVLSKGDMEITAEGNGTVEAKNSTNVYVPYNCKIESLEKENGDRVKAGEVIATVKVDGLEDVIAQLKTSLSTLDSQIANADTTGSATITSKITGRVKRIYIEKGSDVAETMENQQALMEIAADGRLRVKIPAWENVNVGDLVKVKFSDYEEEGRVRKIEGTEAVITISDGYEYSVGEQAVVYNQDDVQLGEGTLFSNQPYYVTGTYGTVESIPVELNQKVYDGTTLINLKNVSYYKGYTDLINQRNELEKKLRKMENFRDSKGITADADGLLSGMVAVDGTDLPAESQLCQILNVESYVLKVQIDELDINDVEMGQKARIVFDSIQDKEYEGAVSKISELGTNTNGVTTYTVTMDLDGDEDIKVNMSANVKIITASRAGILLAPISGIQSVDGKKYVTMVNEDSNKQGTVQTEVTLGLVNSSYAEIVSGAVEGDTITVINENADYFSNMMMGSHNAASGKTSTDGEKNIQEEK